MEIDREDRSFRFNATTELKFKDEASALEIRHVLYDVFNQHMRNLSHLEAEDLSESTTIKGIWRASDSDIREFLTTVSFVARVRLADGSQWVFDRESLSLALLSLDLERLTEDEEEE